MPTLDNQRGQASVEYVGVMIAAALIVLTVLAASSGLATTLRTGVDRAIDSILADSGVPGGQEQAPSSGRASGPGRVGSRGTGSDGGVTAGDVASTGATALDEASGFKDGRAAVSDLADGDLAGAAGHAALALPGGKVAKGGKLLGKVLGMGGKKKPAKPEKPARPEPRGEFSVRDWSGYPSGPAPRPAGPLRLVEGDEYRDALRAKNAANAKLHRERPEWRGKHIHEIKPVKFGGSPTDPANKVVLTPDEHKDYTRFWARQQRYASGG